MNRILIVDDDRTFLLVLRRYLEQRGYAVLAASSASAALELFESETIDLVVSDLVMPEIDGFEFCRRLRSLQSGQLIPFIFLSCCSELDDRIAAHSIGADDYIIKPFEPRELLAKIEAQLDRSRRIRAEIARLLQHRANWRDPEAAADTAVASQRPAGNNGTADVPFKALSLTPAEERVFWEAIQGFTNKQIADRLFVSPRTVQTHLSNILNKLDLQNRAQLVRFAYEQGYQPPSRV